MGNVIELILVDCYVTNSVNLITIAINRCAGDAGGGDRRQARLLASSTRQGDDTDTARVHCGRQDPLPNRQGSG